MFHRRYLSLFSLLFYISLLLTTFVVYAQNTQEDKSSNIVINIPSRTLTLYAGRVLIKEYSIAVGTPATPSPIGSYKIYSKEINPWWYPPEKPGMAKKPPVRPGPENPLGYRWMEFLSTYGIHGTNAPWSIGTAASNGCIRMHEADVEKLYEMIAIGTPVLITYERIRIAEDSNGQVVLILSPDIYKRKIVQIQDMEDKLNQSGFEGAVSDEKLQQMLNNSGDQKIVLVDSIKVRVNRQELTERALVINTKVFIPIAAAAAQLNDNIVWDEAKGVVSNKYKAVQGSSKRERVYVDSENFKRLYGGDQSWNRQGNCYEISVNQVYINGRCIPIELKKIDNVLAVPVMPLAKELGIALGQDKITGDLTVGNIKIPVKVIGNESYILINKIDEAFHGFVYWDQEKERIEINYPYQQE